ncbi:uncharacterized protein LOC125757630 [Rhipicephalus sanguineus]|uniref:uncharacterized protein LOC125757630 n=1 Tax=Rhipicephalus sanguineus TaxID=34632 RepID=UPI0020C329D2|nr:uncharacterized protein LOC125757630 [Rhipicephalus sanguineus]
MHRGGGVAVLVKDQIDATLIGDTPDLECLCVKLSCWGHCFVLYACYRPPDATPDYLIKLQEHMSSYQNKKILLIGDLNLPGVNWELLQANNKSDENANILFDIMLTHDLIQVVNEPTRVQGSSCSVLDIAVRKIPKTISIKDYSRADDARIVDYMEACLTRFADSGSEVSALWATFTTMCKHCIDTFIPTKSKKVNKSTPWMTRAIIQLKRKIKRIKKKHARTGIISELQEKLACAVRDSKDLYFTVTLPNFIKNAPDKFWEYLGESKKSVTEITVNGTSINNLNAIAQHFNDYFHSVFTSTSSGLPLGSVVFQRHEANFISYHGIVSMLLNLKTKTTPRPDDIPNVFLRRYAETIAKFLILLFRESLLCAKVPSDWRMARVVPVFKKGDRLLLQNYRPISLTSSCCKIFEHIIASRINEFLKEKSILTTCQHGFRKGCSTITQLVIVIDSFSKALDANGEIDAVFLDFSEAFDRVIHEK